MRHVRRALTVGVLADRPQMTSQRRVSFTPPGVGEGRDDVDQVHGGKMVHSNEAHSLFK